MRKNMKKMMLVTMFGMMAAGSSMTSMAATYSSKWYQQEDGSWRIRNKESQDVANSWLCDDSVTENGKDVWYLLDPNGSMIAGALVQDKTGNYYSLETEHNGYYGMLRTKNGNYNGVYLEFSQNHDGTFGAITNADGIAALTALYGVKKADVDNSNICYTSAFEDGGKTAEKKTSGGGGGGSSSGGSSSHSGSSSGSNYSEDVSDAYMINVAATSSYDATYYSRYRSEIESVIRDFKDQYIKPGMSDFEKEMQIIQYLVANVVYDYDNYKNKTLPDYTYTAYGALIKGSAVCSGYASAFQRLAAACGIETRYVSNKNHAWNLIKLDGEWYHVDVTWEDPVPTNDYGFGNIRNTYINRTDEEIRTASSHKTWSPSSIVCNGYKYGRETIAAYMATGKVDTSNAKSYAQKVQEANAAQEKLLTETGHVFDFTTTDEAAEKIFQIAVTEAAVGKKSVSYGIRFHGYDTKISGNYSKISDLKKEIDTKVDAKLQSWNWKELGMSSCKKEYASIYGYSNGGNYADYYVVTGSVSYTWDMAMDCTVTYVDAEGKAVHTQSGKASEAGIFNMKVPSGYAMLPNTGVKITSGSASADRTSITVKDRKAVEATAQVYKNPIPYTLRYLFNGKEVSVQSGTMSKDSRVGVSVQIPYGNYVLKSADDIVYKNGSGSWNMSSNRFTVTSYAPVQAEVILHAKDGNDTEMPTYGDIYNSAEVQEHYESGLLVNGRYGNILHSNDAGNEDMEAAAKSFMQITAKNWLYKKEQLADGEKEYMYFFLDMKDGTSFDEESLEVSGSKKIYQDTLNYTVKAAYLKSFEYYGGTLQMWIAAISPDDQEPEKEEEMLKSAGQNLKKAEEELKGNDQELKEEEEELKDNEQETEEEEEELKDNEQETEEEEEELKDSEQETGEEEEELKDSEQETEEEEELKNSEQETKEEEEELKNSEQETEEEEEELKDNDQETEKEEEELESEE